MTARRTRVVGLLRWLRLQTGERITTCGRFWLVPHGRTRVWWLYMRQHDAGDLRRTTWTLLYRSHKLATAMHAGVVAHRSGVLGLVRSRAALNELAAALDAGELKAETFVDDVAPLVRLWGAR